MIRILGLEDEVRPAYAPGNLHGQEYMVGVVLPESRVEAVRECGERVSNAMVFVEWRGHRALAG